MILVRREGKTVISMANDYRGALTEFALVVPVPQVLERDQIHIGERKLFERIDAYSAPRLAEYFDPDPCAAEGRALDGRRRRAAAGIAWRRRNRAATRRSASPSRRRTPSANTTS